MSRRIAGIDVHKKMLAVVMSKAEIEGEYQFERRMFGSNREQLRSLAACSSSKWPRNRHGINRAILKARLGGTGAVLETAPREARRRKAQVQNVAFGAGAVQSRTARTKGDFVDAEWLVKRLVARELTLSFVPDAEQRLWRTVTRKRYQLRCNRVRLQNQVKSLLEEAHLKLSSLITDLMGVSARGMLKALADGEDDPRALAALADERLGALPRIS